MLLSTHHPTNTSSASWEEEASLWTKQFAKTFGNQGDWVLLGMGLETLCAACFQTIPQASMNSLVEARKGMPATNLTTNLTLISSWSCYIRRRTYRDYSPT